MRRISQPLLVCVLVIGVGLTGCGGGAHGDPVALVGSTPITSASLRHWTAVQLATDYQANPQHPLPSGVVYEASDYAPCVAHLRAAASAAQKGVPLGSRELRSALAGGRFEIPKSAAGSAKAKARKTNTQPLSSAQLERECAQSYRRVEEHVLNVLIVFQWNIQEAEADGVNPTEAEVRDEYTRFSREHFPSRGELQRYLANTGETFGDELLRMRMDMIGTRVAEKQLAEMGIDPAAATPGQEQEYLASFHASVRHWVSETSCRRDYIVQNCRQYKGPLAPDPRI